MADSIIGTLRAILTLDSSQYTKGTSEAVAATGKLDTGLINLAAGLNVVEQGYRYTKQAMDMYIGSANDAYASVAEFQRMTGASINEAGRWHDMLEKMGLDLTDLTATMRIFSNNVDTAFNDPNSASAKAFNRLNISLVDSNGNLKDTNTLILETMTALGRMQNGAEKTALSVDTLGRNAQNLTKAFDEGTNAMQSFNETQTDITSDGMKNYKEYTKSVNEFNAALKDIEVTVGTRLMPFLSGLANLIKTNVLPAIEAILDKFEYLGYVVGAIQRGDQIDDYQTYIERRRLYNLNLAYTDSQSSKTHTTSDNKVIVTNIAPVSSGGGGYSGSGGGSGGSGGGGSGSNYQWPTSPTGTGVYMIRPARYDPATGQTSPALYGNASTGEVSTNPYQWNTSGSNGVSQATTTYNASFGHMLSQLANVSGLSSSAQAVIQKYLYAGQENTQVGEWIQILKNRPDSPEAQAIIQKVLTAQGPNAGDNTAEAAINYLQGSMVSGAIHSYIDPSGNEYNALKSEWDRLTTGSHPMFDQNGNLIIYVMMDGQEVAKAQVDKLRLLGVA